MLWHDSKKLLSYRDVSCLLLKFSIFYFSWIYSENAFVNFEFKRYFLFEGNIATLTGISE